jgi:hypothetical protein
LNSPSAFSSTFLHMCVNLLSTGSWTVQPMFADEICPVMFFFAQPVSKRLDEIVKRRIVIDKSAADFCPRQIEPSIRELLPVNNIVYTISGRFA